MININYSDDNKLNLSIISYKSPNLKKTNNNGLLDNNGLLSSIDNKKDIKDNIFLPDIVFDKEIDDKLKIKENGKC